MNLFVEKYLSIIYEQQGNTEITLEEYHKFIMSAVKFDENLNVISEHLDDLIDVPDELIRFLVLNKHSLVKGDSIKCLLKSSRHWRNIKNIQINDMYFDIFDFKNENEIDKFNYSCFKIEEDLSKYREEFIENCGSLFGFYGFFNGIHIVCINSNAADVHQTMHHELSHFIQSIGSIRISNGLNLNDVKHKDVLKSEFDVEYDKVISYFSNKEFMPHIDDIVTDLKRLRLTFYSDITGLQFQNKVYDFLKVRNRKELEENDLFNNFWKMKNGEVSSLMMLLFSKISGYKFQKILNWIKNVFI